MIEAKQLTKKYGETTAVDGLEFTVRPGAVTGFLGPNGAGKSTTMRLVVGLDAPTTGSVTVNGKHYKEHSAPLQEVGALLEAKAAHPGRSAYNHLLAQAQTHGIPKRRVDEVIELTGLQSVAKKRSGQFSLGMGQRLGIATALLGDPATIMLDEPVNGLDPEGVLWIRNLLTRLAEEGRTVFVSSHLMSEMALVANRLIIVGRAGCWPTPPSTSWSGKPVATPCAYPPPTPPSSGTRWPGLASRSSGTRAPRSWRSTACRHAPSAPRRPNTASRCTS